MTQRGNTKGERSNLEFASPRATGRLSALNIEKIEATNTLFQTEKFNRRLVLGFLVFAVSWILLSDTAVELWIADPEMRAHAQTFKGLAFVTLTSALFFIVLARHYRQMRQVERKLQARDTHIGRIIDTMANGVALIDLDGTIVDINPALGTMLGADQDEIVGRPLAPGRTSESHRLTPASVILEYARRNGQWSGELIREHKHGNLVPIHLTLAPLFDTNDALTGYVADYVDLREIKTAEAHLDGLGGVIEQLATENDIELLGQKAVSAALEFTGSDVGGVVLIGTEDGRLEHRWLLGLSGDCGKDNQDQTPGFVARIIESSQPRIIEDVQSAPDQLGLFGSADIESLAAVAITVRGVNRGALVVATCEARDAFDDRQVPLLEAVARQIGVALHRHELLEESRRSEARFRNVVNSVPDILYSATVPDFETQFISPSVERILEVPTDEFLANPHLWRDLIHEEDLPTITYLIEQSLKEEERYSVEYRSWTPDHSQFYWFEDRGRIERDASGNPRAITGVISDITARKKAEERLAFLAFHDRLTGLPNRLGLIEKLKPWLNQTDVAGILLYCDLDRFHLVNDIHGHDSGDALLMETAARFNEILPEGGILSRIGADEFVAFIPDLPDTPTNESVGDLESIAQHYALQIMASFREPFSIHNQPSYLSATIGIGLLDEAIGDARTLLKNAHRALAHAKEMGPANFAFYAGELAKRQQRRLSLQSRIHSALDNEEFALYYQPLIDLTSGAIIGAEALLRWQTTDGEKISPAEFIPVAEESGMIIPLGDWVLQRACQDLRQWQDNGMDLKLSLNLSPRQFFHLEIVEKILHAVDDAGVSPSQLELELTESAMLVDPEQTAQILARLQKAGFSIAIDDFGTGYSSLERLKQLPVQTLKIDRSFVRDLPGASRDASIVRSVITLSQNFEMASLAEGIETREQWEYLREIGCQFGQGFYFSRPVPADRFRELFDDTPFWMALPASTMG